MTHGMWGSATYRSWNMMLQRTGNHKSTGFCRYGGRGVKVCEQWKMFSSFLTDMGERPEGTSLDRYPNKDGNYEPGNCRWATRKQQLRNTRRTRLDESKAHQIRWLAEMGYSQRHIARMYGVARETARNVIDGKNWVPE